MGYSFKKMLNDLGIDKTFNKCNLKHICNVHEIIYERMSFAEVQAKNGHTLTKEVYLRDLKDYYLENKDKEKEIILQIDIYCFANKLILMETKNWRTTKERNKIPFTTAIELLT